MVGLIFVGARISASPPRSLAAGPATPAGTILAVRWPNKGLPEDGELAASEQAQLEAARARRGWRPIRRALTSRFNTSTHRRRHLLESTTHSRRSSLDIIPQSHNHASAELQPQAYIFATSAVERIAQVPPRGAAGCSLHHAALLSARSSLRRAAHDACGPTPTASISKLQYISSSRPQS